MLPEIDAWPFGEVAVTSGKEDAVLLFQNAALLCELSSSSVSCYIAQEDEEVKIFLRAAKAAQEAGDEEAVLWFATTAVAGKGSEHFNIMDGKNRGSGTALHQAVQDEALEVARRLLEVKANVNAVGGAFRRTPLHVAADQGHADLITMLLEAKADPYARDEDGRTPVDCAKQHGGRGLAPFVTGARSLTLLSVLVTCEGPEVIEALEIWKKEARRKDMFGYNKPLDRAHLRERLRVVLAEGLETLGNWCILANEDYTNLRFQNMIPKPEVQASLWHLPGLSAADACDPDLLRALAKTANEDVFQTDTVQAIVQAAWAQTRLATAWEVISCLLMVVLLCVASLTFRHEQPGANESSS